MNPPIIGNEFLNVKSSITYLVQRHKRKITLDQANEKNLKAHFTGLFQYLIKFMEIIIQSIQYSNCKHTFIDINGILSPIGMLDLRRHQYEFIVTYFFSAL
jgi:hypothetical protein